MCSPTYPDNAALVAAARDGDRAAWEALFTRNDRLILAVCRAHRLSESDIADVRQITWLRALEHLHRLKQPARVASWLAAIARHECLRHIRHAKRVVPAGDDVDGWYDDDSAPDAGLLASERREALRGALSLLEGRDRALIELLYGELATSYIDIGRRLQMPVGSIGPTRGRVLERLRRHEALAGLAAAA